jgi:hypothetical protein
MVQFGKIGNSNLDYQNANQIQLILENYLVIIVPCMAKTRENIRAFTPDNENAEKSRLQFLANLKLIGIPVSQPKSGNRFQWKYHGL